MKKLPIGIQNIEKLITENYLYIDKTKYIYELIQTGSVYFLSRPRRFGKSLLISTLEAIFQGKKDLFKGLWIQNQKEFKWESYPVIRLDLSNIDTQTPERFISVLKQRFVEIANQHGVDYQPNESEKESFYQLILKVSQRGKVVVLVDEYDKPIIDHITDTKTAIQFRSILKSVYGVLKSLDPYLKFIFLTGISKFSKVSVFSDLNHLTDISMRAKYGAILGYTQDELTQYFKHHIQEMTKVQNLSEHELINAIKNWYNGYLFSEDSEPVYNPFSTLNCFSEYKFKSYWFETATPSFLVNLIKEKQYDFTQNEYYRAEESQFSTYEVDNLHILPLLFQTGYLTIKQVIDGRRYILGYPNLEVKNGFVSYLASDLTREPNLFGQILWDLEDALRTNQIETCMKTLQTIYAKIPYDIQLPQEKYYQSLWYLIFTLLGLRINAEQRTNQGRIDGIIETKDHIYIFEFKVDQPASVALQQIQDKNYAQSYQNSGKPITLIGVAFDSKTRNIVEWVTG